MLVHKAVSKIKLTALVLSGVVLVAGLGVAQAKKKTVGDLLKGIEKRAKAVNLKKSNRALPKYKSFQGAEVNLKKVQPPSRSDLYYAEGTDEAELEKVTDAGIRQLFKLTQRYKKSSKRGELWLRLAELYVEKARLIEFRLQSEYDDKLKALAEGKIKKQPRLNLKPAQAYNKKAIQLYEWFLRDFPKDKKVDQALFFLGYNYFEIGNESKGKAYYERLTKQFPRSPYVEETNFALGEYHFERREWKEALSYYQKVTRNKRARLYSFALYKSAWSLYKMNQPKKGLRALEQVIRVGRLSKGNDERSAGGASRIRLASEASKDLVVFYAEAGDYRGAEAYFRKVVGRRGLKGMLERLAYYYAGRGFKNQARYTFRNLIESAPNSPKSYDYQYQIVSLFSAAGNDKVFREELYRWIEGYGPGSVWARSNSDNEGLISKAAQLIETTLRNYILQQHQTAQNSRAPYSQEMAKSGYELYFTTFKSGSKLPEMHFFYGELLFDLKEYEKAAYHYLWVADNAPKSQYFEQSVLNAILSLEKKLPTADEIKKIVGESLEPVEFDRTIKAFEKTSLRYVQSFPKAKDTVAIYYRVGSLYYYYNQFNKAIRVFIDIIDKHPKSEYAEYAANLLLDIYNLKNDFEGLTKAGEKILANPALAASPLGKKVKEIIERASFKQAEELGKGKSPLKSAMAYEKFALKNPKSDLAVSAFYNAGVNYEKGGDLFKAATMYAQVANSRTKKYADLKGKSEKFLAGIYEKTGQYKKAAEAFEKYAASHPNEKESADYYYNAGVIRQGMNFYKSALRNYQKYFDKSNKTEKKEVLFLMGDIWEKRGNKYRAIAYYEKYIDSNTPNAAGVIEASFRIAKLNDSLRRTTKADEWYQKTLNIYRNLEKSGKSIGVQHAAEAHFNLVQKTYEAFRKVRLPKNPSAQRAALNKKINLLDRLKEELKVVIKYDDGYMVVASLATLGLAWQHLNATILGAPLPKGLDAEGIKVYKAEVQKAAEPSKREAITAFKSAVDKANSLNTYNEWVKVAHDQLHYMDPEKFQEKNDEVILTKVPDWMEL